MVNLFVMVTRWFGGTLLHQDRFKRINDAAQILLNQHSEIFEDKLYIQTGKKKDVYKQILSNPNVEICAFKDGKWIRIEGKLVPDDRLEAKKDMSLSFRGSRNQRIIRLKGGKPA